MNKVLQNFPLRSLSTRLPAFVDTMMPTIAKAKSILGCEGTWHIREVVFVVACSEVMWLTVGPGSVWRSFGEKEGASSRGATN